MSEVLITNDILVSFAGTALALLLAGLIWFLKSAYEKHRSEKFALAKFERIFANNLTILKDNFEFIDNWISSLKNGRPYSFQFQKYFLNEDETFKISNLKLVNNILSINHKLRRTGLDFENLYKSYWDIIPEIDAIQDKARKEENLSKFHETIISTLQEIKLNYEPLKKDMVSCIATVRAVDNVRFHSLFGYLSLLNIDVLPRVTEELVKTEIDKLNKNIDANSKISQSEEHQA